MEGYEDCPEVPANLPESRAESWGRELRREEVEKIGLCRRAGSVSQCMCTQVSAYMCCACTHVEVYFEGFRKRLGA